MESTLEKVCRRIYSGGTPSTQHPEYWNGHEKWLSSGETRQRFIYDTEKYITQEGINHSSTQLAHKNDIVMASAGQGYTRGQVSYLMDDMYVNQSVLVFVPDSKVLLPLYLYYNLDSRYEELRQLSDGTSTRGSLSGRIVKGMRIEFPELEKQKKIVDILYSLDRKIEINNHINKNLFEEARILYQSWFIDFNPFNGAMPTEWKQGTVDDIIDIHDKKRVPLSGSQRDRMEKIYPYYGAASCMDYVDDYLFDGVYLLLGEDGTVVDENGYPMLQYVDGKFWVNNHAHILTGRNGFSVEELYLFFSFKQIKGIVTGAVQPKVSQANLKSLAAIIPDRETLRQFDNIIQPLFSEYRELRNQNIQLEQLRDSLLPRLMSGGLDVSNVEL